MDITGANLCLVVVMIVSTHVTVLGDVGVCDDTPCLNGGQCIDLSSPEGPQEFKCSCREGFKGLTCQKHIDPCVEEPCFNGGSCVPNGEHYHCVCTDGFEGKFAVYTKAKTVTCPKLSRRRAATNHVVLTAYAKWSMMIIFAEAKEESKDTERSSEVRAEDEKTKEATWDIRNMLISLFVIFLLFMLVLLFLCIHCSRVYKRRTEIENIRKARKAAGLEPPPMPGWLETSNKLCSDCMCYLCMTPNKESSDFLVIGNRNMEHRGALSGRTHFADVQEPPEALYTSDNIGNDFYAYEDPNDYRLRASPYPPNLNENKGYRNHNRNFKNSGVRYYRRPPKPSPRKSPGRRYYYKRRQMIPVNYDDDGEEEDSSGEEDESEDDGPMLGRAPRGLLPGFERVSPERQCRRPVRSAVLKSVPAIRENRRMIKTKHSRALSPQFPFRPIESTWWEKKNPVPSVDNLEMDQSEYSAACGDTDENADESSEEEGVGHKMQFEDDGYMSTSRLSESDAGGRGRDPQSMQLYTEIASRNYQARQQKAFQGPRHHQGIQWPEGVVAAPPPPRRPARDLDVDQPNEEEHADDAEFGKSRYGYGANHNSGVSQYTSECGEFRQIKGILKKNKSTQRPKETVIHVKSGVVDGQNKPFIYRDASRNYGSDSTRNMVEYKQNRNTHNHDLEKARYSRRLPYPPTYPPPMYEDVAYS